MAETSGKGEESAQELLYLAPVDVGPECCAKDGNNSASKLQGIGKFDVEDGLCS